MTLSSGTRIGRYEVRSPLGAGGMGEVYLAWDHDLEREVALKVLREGSGDADRARRFVQEARAASGLHHPNVAHVYEIGSHDDLRFIAMEHVAGETLRARLRRGKPAAEETLHIAVQITAALSDAHRHGIIHRDIKPENVIVTPDGYAKVLDFGLAKLHEIRGEDAATLLRTSPGVAMGTIGYMSPEQLVGAEVTPAADVFSLGVVLYEMVAGRRPFEGATATEVVQAILTKTPAPVDGPLAPIIDRALSKNAADRYHDAGEVHDALRSLAPKGHVSARFGKRTALAAIALALIAALGWVLARNNRRSEALRQIGAAETYVKERKLAEAFEATMAAAAVLPDHDRIADLLTRTSVALKVESDPPGATAYAQRFNGPAERVRLGVTPLDIPRIARADYLVTFEKSGYTPVSVPLSATPLTQGGTAFLRALPTVRVKLVEASKTPPGMVFVEGGPYRLSTYDRPSDRLVQLHDFFIDRQEVANRDFDEFIRAGGYRRRELWKYPFVDGQKTLTFEQAMARLRDTTGLPAPRNWSGGVPPAGRENHPVTDVTWYEAAAFAEWKGKRLPTVHQWEKAARHPATSGLATSFPWGPVGEGVDANERANFRGKGTLPVDALPFGVSPWGALNMAGNVSEWCRNPYPPGYSARGGSWKDAAYSFGQTAALPAFYSAPTLGFRCVTGGGSEEGDFAIHQSGFVPVYKPVDDKTFDGFRRRYEYRRDPLNPRVIETAEGPDWTREKIVLDVNGKTVPLYLYLPKTFRRPLQVIHFAPAGDVTGGYRTLPQSIESWVAPLIRGGRALFAVELEGYLGRPQPPGFVAPDRTEEEYVDYTVQRVTELRRALDYIATRPDLDRARVALLGISAGGGPGVFVSALEQRYRSVVMHGTGISPREIAYAAAANRINFVSRITAPTLMLHGRYDEDKSLRSEAEPMFRLLSAPKRLEVFEGGHIAPQEVGIPLITKWLDETMGPVQQ